MTLNTKFLHTDIKDLEISRSRFVVGIIIGILTSLSFYGFLYMTRESFRLMSISEEYDIWVLTDPEVHFYNFFLASIAIIYGQSLCFGYWTDRPRRLYDRIYRRKSAILNDQRALNWFFISWFFRLFTLLGFLYSFSFKYWYYTFELYPKYNYVLILIIIVLYFQTWNSIKRTFGNKSNKWQLISIILVILFSFGFSRINFVDYKKLNESILKRSVYSNYNMDIPRSDYSDRLYNRSLIINLYIAGSKEDNNSSFLIHDGNAIKIDELRPIISMWSETLAPSDAVKMTVRLSIDKQTKMGIVTQVKNELSSCGVHRIAYAVAPADSEIDSRFFRNHSISRTLPIRNHPVFDFHTDFINNLRSIQNPIWIQHTSNKNTLRINGVSIHKKHFIDEIKKIIKHDSTSKLYYQISDSIDYDSYIFVISNTSKAIIELKDLYSIEKFKMPYIHLDYNERRQVDSMYSYPLAEITEDIYRDLYE